MLRALLCVVALAGAARAGKSPEPYDADVYGDEVPFGSGFAPGTRRKLQTTAVDPMVQLLQASKIYDIRGTELSSVKDSALVWATTVLKVAPWAPLEWPGANSVFAEDSQCKCKYSELANFPLSGVGTLAAQKAEQKLAMCGPLNEPTFDASRELTLGNCRPREFSGLDLSSSGSQLVYNNLGGLGGKCKNSPANLPKGNPEDDDIIRAGDTTPRYQVPTCDGMQRDNLNFVYLRGITTLKDRPVSLRMDNTSVYKPWDRWQNGFLKEMFQTNLAPIFDPTGIDQPFAILDGSVCQLPNCALFPDLVCSGGFACAGKFISEIFKEVGLFDSIDLNASNINAITLTYTFFYEDTGKIATLEETMISFWDFDQAFADGEEAATRESMLIDNYDAMFVSSDDQIPLEFIFSSTFESGLDAAIDRAALKAMPNSLPNFRTLAATIVKSVTNGKVLTTTQIENWGDEDLRKSVLRPRGWGPGTWEAKWNTPELGYDNWNSLGATVSDTNVRVAYTTGVVMRSKSLGYGIPTVSSNPDGQLRPIAQDPYVPFFSGISPANPVIQGAYAACLYGCAGTRCTVSDWAASQNGGSTRCPANPTGITTTCGVGCGDVDPSRSLSLARTTIPFDFGNPVDLDNARGGTPDDVLGVPLDYYTPVSPTQQRDRSATFLFRGVSAINFAYRSEIGFVKRQQLETKDPDQVNDNLFVEYDDQAFSYSGDKNDRNNWKNVYKPSPRCTSITVADLENRHAANPKMYLGGLRRCLENPSLHTGATKFTGSVPAYNNDCKPMTSPCEEYVFYDPLSCSKPQEDGSCPPGEEYGQDMPAYGGRAYYNTRGGRNFLISGYKLPGECAPPFDNCHSPPSTPPPPNLPPPSLPPALPPPPSVNCTCLIISWNAKDKGCIVGDPNKPGDYQYLYDIEYNVVKPVRSATRWYESHPKVVYAPGKWPTPGKDSIGIYNPNDRYGLIAPDTTVAGKQAHAWFKNSGPWPNGDSIVDTNSVQGYLGGVAFYAYGYPYQWSSNTGFEMGNRTVLTTVVQKDGCILPDSQLGQAHICYSVIYIIDKPWDLSGGSYAMDICSTKYAYENFPYMDIRFEDDSWNTFDWDLTRGRGNYMWRWKECCSDGFVMSFFPNPSKRIYSYTLAARLAEIEGVYGGTLYIEFDPITARPVSHRIPSYMTSMEPFKGVQFKTLDCNKYCERFTNCGECSADINCAYDLKTATCIPSGCPEPAGAGYPYNDILMDIRHRGDTYITYGEQCPMCESKDNAYDCINAAGCGWAPFEKFCVSGGQGSEQMFHSDCGGKPCTIVQWEWDWKGNCGGAPCPYTAKMCYKSSWNDKKAFQASGERFTWYGVTPFPSTSAMNPNIGNYQVAGVASLDSLVVYLVTDTSDKSYLVTVADSTASVSAGNLKMKLHITGAPSASSRFTFNAFDGRDSTTYVSTTPGAGTATLDWTWSAGQNDGFVFGPLPVTNWTVGFDYDDASSDGLEFARFAGDSPQAGTPSFVGTHISKLGSGFGGGMLEAMECNDYCMQYTGCTECIKDERCAFARLNGGCVSRQAFIATNDCPAPKTPPNRMFQTSQTGSTIDLKIRVPDKINFHCPCVYNYQIVVYTMGPAAPSGCATCFNTTAGMQMVKMEPEAAPTVPIREGYRFTYTTLSSSQFKPGTRYQVFVWACSQDECGDTPLVEEIFTA